MKILDTKEEKKIKALGTQLPKNLVCLSHLRWDFVFQRPQQLLTRLSKTFSIFFIEEPVYDITGPDHYEFLNRGKNIVVIVPHLRTGLGSFEQKNALKNLFDSFMANRNLSEYIFWYYTPMALDFSRKYNPELTVFDCMDELSTFKFAPEELTSLENELLIKADLVFTGGHSIYEAKKNRHANIYPMPSSIDKEHFVKARGVKKSIGEPVTLGFFGVIDERFDAELIREMADQRPHWRFELIGPVVKIDPETLPKNKNISYLGQKNYQDLPQYLATWDIALIPFLLNESTRFISPTKTPEYLAAGKPVISTPIRDVINPYGTNKLVYIGASAADFINAAERELESDRKAQWLARVDAFLAEYSWEKTTGQMISLVRKTIINKSCTSLAQ